MTKNTIETVIETLHNPCKSCKQQTLTQQSLNQQPYNNHPNTIRLTELKEIFDLFDADEDGYISYTEFYAVLKALNKYFSETQIKESFHNLSTNSRISFDAFIDIMDNSMPANDYTEADIINAFNVFDVDSNGYITINDLRIIMNKLDETLTEKQLYEMFKEVNIANNGKISYEEFKNTII